MSIEKNKELLSHWVDELNVENLDSMEALFHDRFIDHNPFPGQTPDKAGYIGLIRTAHTEWFPGYQVRLDDLVAEDDKVAARITVDAVHSGTVLGAAPTGNPICWQTMAIFRVENGQLIERWEVSDSLSLFAQLGLVELPSAPNP